METPEIKKGDFVYRDTLFVDLGTTKRHPRASPSYLKALLLPKSNTLAPKDQVAHWYEAQLIHYGLPRSKDKSTAKVRLTNAITAKTLAVPRELVALEAEMKKEYAGVLRKGKASVTAAGKTASTSKAKSSNSKTTIELEIDGIKVKIDREAIKAAKKKTSGSKDTTPQPKGAKASGAKPKAATMSSPIQSARPKETPPKPKAAIMSSPMRQASPSQAMKKQTARRGKPFSYGAGAHPSSSPTTVYDYTPSSFRHDSDMDDPPPSYESIASNQPQQTSNSNAVQISGTYFFPGPAIQPFNLALQIDQASQKLWGRFQIGSKEGVIRMDDISSITSGDPILFGWRSEDQNDGFMKFGRGCDGTIAFDGDGWIRGHFKGLMYGADVEFEGELVNNEGLNVAEASGVWDDFPRKTYGRSGDRNGRWQP